jgi:hypothetical protein
MRSLFAAALLCCSAAQAGTFTVNFSSPSLHVVDLTPADANGAAMTVIPTGAPGSTLSEWNTPISFGGEFWADFNNVQPGPNYTLTGTLGAHSAVEWTMNYAIDGTFAPFDALLIDRAFFMGGVGGTTENGSINTQEIFSPSIFETDVHLSGPFEFMLRNDADIATGFTLNMMFRLDATSDFARPVPEPSTYLMMLGGLALLPLARRTMKTTVDRA